MSDGQFGTDFFNQFSIVGGVSHPPTHPLMCAPECGIRDEPITKIAEIKKIEIKVLLTE